MQKRIIAVAIVLVGIALLVLNTDNVFFSPELKSAIKSSFTKEATLEGKEKVIEEPDLRGEDFGELCGLVVPECPYDFNNDGVVDDADDSEMQSRNMCLVAQNLCCNLYDLNNDGVVNNGDRDLLQNYYGLCPGRPVLEGACTPREIRDGDNYRSINGGQENPEWVWMIKNLNQNQKTGVYSAIDISGPVIGVANGNEIIKEIEPYDGTFDFFENTINLPNNYQSLSLLFYQPSDGENPEFREYPLETSIKREIMDTTQFVGVPQEYQQYLSTTSQVLTLSTDVLETESQFHGKVPAIMTTANMFFDIVGDYYGFSIRIQGDATYTYSLENVNEDLSVDFRVDRWTSGHQEYGFEHINVPFGEEFVTRGKKIKIQASDFSEDFTHHEWAAYSVVNQNQQFDAKLPSAKMVMVLTPLPPVINATPTTRPLLLFYENPETGQLIFHSVIYLHPNDNPVFGNPRIDYGYMTHRFQYSLSTLFHDYGEFFFGMESTYYRGPHLTTERFTTKYLLNSQGGIISLGNEQNVAEGSELDYDGIFTTTNNPGDIYSPSEHLGDKNFDMRSNSVVVKDPAQHSLNEEVTFSLHRKPFTSTLILRRFNELGTLLNTPLWRHLDIGYPLSSPISDVYVTTYYGTLFPQIITPEFVERTYETNPYIDVRNPLGLSEEEVLVEYSMCGKVDAHEAIVFGGENPLITTALITGFTEELEPEKIYFGASPSYADSGQGIEISLNSFDPQEFVFNDQTFTIELTDASDTSAHIRVTDSQGNSDSSGELNEGETETIGIFEITLLEADETNFEVSARILVRGNGWQFTDGGIKFLYVFDDAVDLTGASLTEPIGEINFLGECFEIVEVMGVDRMKIRKCSCDEGEIEPTGCEVRKVCINQQCVETNIPPELSPYPSCETDIECCLDCCGSCPCACAGSCNPITRECIPVIGGGSIPWE